MRKNKLIVLICLLVFTLVLLSACSNDNQSDNNSSMNVNEDVSKISSDSNEGENRKQDDDLVHKTLRFHGESVNWKVEYLAITKVTEQTNSGPIGNQTDILKLQYLGDGQPLTEIEYYINSPAGNKSGNDVTLKDGISELNIGGCEKCVILTENNVMDMTIEWAGEREIIKLETQ